MAAILLDWPPVGLGNDPAAIAESMFGLPAILLAYSNLPAPNSFSKFISSSWKFPTKFSSMLWRKNKGCESGSFFVVSTIRNHGSDLIRTNNTESTLQIFKLMTNRSVQVLIFTRAIQTV